MSKILTLDTRGYVSDPPLVVDIVMRNFFVANHSQTNVHWDRINSLPYLISKYANDMAGLSQAIERALENMLKGYFESAMVECTIKDIEPDGALQNIEITATVFKDGASLDVGRLLSLVKNKISNIEHI